MCVAAETGLSATLTLENALVKLVTLALTVLSLQLT